MIVMGEQPMIKSFFARRAAKILIAASALVVIVIVAVVIALPAAAATACPRCYGLEQSQPNVFVERGMPQQARDHVAEILSQARVRVRDFYGRTDGNPRILVCASQSCYQHIGGGGTRGKSYYDAVLILSPRGTDPVIASHELAHIELHNRIGFIRFVSGAIPSWFDEGLAVVVSDDPRYLAPVGAADRCLVDADGPLPTGMREWSRRAGADDQLYAKAACRVSRWLAKKGGTAAVPRLLSQVARGTPFAQAYAE